MVRLDTLGTDGRLRDVVAGRAPVGAPMLRMDRRGHGLSEEGPGAIEARAGDVATHMRCERSHAASPQVASTASRIAPTKSADRGGPAYTGRARGRSVRVAMSPPLRRA